jgi:hypothetical protein
MKGSSSQPPAMTLDVSAELIAVVVERAALLVADRQQSRFEPLVTVDQLATALAMTPEWVRRHQAELGAFRLSEGGGRNPIRFRVSDVEWVPRSAPSETGSREGNCSGLACRSRLGTGMTALAHQLEHSLWYALPHGV